MVQTSEMWVGHDAANGLNSTQRRCILGIPFTRGPLAYLRRNRFYVGEVVYQGQVYPGEHPALLDRDLFEAVQRRLGEQRASHVTERAIVDACRPSKGSLTVLREVAEHQA